MTVLARASSKLLLFSAPCKFSETLNTVLQPQRQLSIKQLIKYRNNAIYFSFVPGEYQCTQLMPNLYFNGELKLHLVICYVVSMETKSDARVSER
jgi:hypothetical protein